MDILNAIEPTQSDCKVVLLTRHVTGADRWMAAKLRDRLSDVTLLSIEPNQPNEANDAGLVVVLTARPGEWSQSDQDQLASNFSNAEFVVAAGTWCEGELRTGQPWSDVQRVYWYDLPNWVDAWLQEKSEPLDMSDNACPLVAVRSCDRESFLAVEGAIRPHGYRAVWLPQFGPRPLVTGIDAAIWAGPQLDGRQAADLAAFCCGMRALKAPVIVMLDFPRIDEMLLAKSVGAADVIGKPWDVESVIRMLAKALRPTQERQSELKLKLAA